MRASRYILPGYIRLGTRIFYTGKCFVANMFDVTLLFASAKMFEILNLNRQRDVTVKFFCSFREQIPIHTIQSASVSMARMNCVLRPICLKFTRCSWSHQALIKRNVIERNSIG